MRLRVQMGRNGGRVLFEGSLCKVPTWQDFKLEGQNGMEEQGRGEGAGQIQVGLDPSCPILATGLIISEF